MVSSIRVILAFMSWWPIFKNSTAKIGIYTKKVLPFYYLSLSVANLGNRVVCKTIVLANGDQLL